MVVALTGLYYFFYRMDSQAKAGWIVTETAIGAALLSGPLSLFLLGQGIQINHFTDRAWRAIGYAALVGGGWIIQRVMQWLDGRVTNQTQLWRAKKLVFGLVVLACCAVKARSAYRIILWPTTAWVAASSPNAERYKLAFAEIHAQLTGSQYTDMQVLGTFDVPLANWWEYRNKYLYVPDYFNSIASDNEIEARLCSLMALLKVTREDFEHLLDEKNFLMRLTGEKYQANDRYTPWPIGDYSPDVRVRIAGKPLDSWWWLLELPLSERKRLIDRYGDFDESAEPHRKLDIVILTKNAIRQYMHPEKGSLRLAWVNDLFEIWTTTH
jgi:hypothetical protein